MLWLFFLLLFFLISFFFSFYLFFLSSFKKFTGPSVKRISRRVRSPASGKDRSRKKGKGSEYLSGETQFCLKGEVGSLPSTEAHSLRMFLDLGAMDSEPIEFFCLLWYGPHPWNSDLVIFPNGFSSPSSVGKKGHLDTLCQLFFLLSKVIHCRQEYNCTFFPLPIFFYDADILSIHSLIAGGSGPTGPNSSVCKDHVVCYNEDIHGSTPHFTDGEVPVFCDDL